MSRATSRALILIALLLIILIALYFFLRPAPTQESANTPEPASTESQQKNVDLAITGGNTMTPKEINVNEGDHVNLRITSDEPLEFHLHGYDLAKDLEANEPQELTFDATITGRFEIEDEETQEQLGELLVQPR